MISNANDGALMVDGELAVKNGADINAEGLFYGVQAGSLSITAGSELTAGSSEAYCNAIYVWNGNLNISNSTVTATAAWHI